MTRVALGMGCDRGTPLQTLETALQQALQQAGLTTTAVATLATIDLKRDEPALLQLGVRYGWPLRFYSPAQLARVVVPNPSEVVRRFMGTPAVAEAAALLAAGTEMEDLIIEKHKHRGADGKNATVSVARMRND